MSLLLEAHCDMAADAMDLLPAQPALYTGYVSLSPVGNSRLSKFSQSVEGLLKEMECPS